MDVMNRIKVECQRMARIGLVVGWLCALVVPAFAQKLDVEKEKIVRSGRPDGRQVSTRGFVQLLIRGAQPRLAFNPDFTPKEFREWRKQVRAKMEELMNFPKPPPQPAPRRLWIRKRDGYALEKWEL